MKPILRHSSIKSFVLFFTVFHLLNTANGQRIIPPNKDFVIVHNQAWDLRNDGTLKIFDIDKCQQIQENLNLSFQTKFLTKDSHDNIIIITKGDSLMLIDPVTLAHKNITPAHFQKNSYGFSVNSVGVCFQIINEGLQDTQTGQTYMPGKEFCFSEWRLRGANFNAWDNVDVGQYYMDKNDVFWFSVSYGEWGDDMFAFDTKIHQFIKLEGDFITGRLFETNTNMYCYGTGFKNEPFIQFSAYSRFDVKKESLSLYELTGHYLYNTLNNKGHDELMKSQKSMHAKDYEGISAFNLTDGHIYFLSPFGMYKGDPARNLNDISYWTKVDDFKFQQQDIKPRRHHYIKLRFDKDQKTIDTQEDYDITAPYEVYKVEFSKGGKLIFASYYDGLGVFDGKKIVLLDKSASF